MRTSKPDTQREVCVRCTRQCREERTPIRPFGYRLGTANNRQPPERSQNTSRTTKYSTLASRLAAVLWSQRASAMTSANSTSPKRHRPLPPTLRSVYRGQTGMRERCGVHGRRGQTYGETSKPRSAVARRPGFTRPLHTREGKTLPNIATPLVRSGHTPPLSLVLSTGTPEGRQALASLQSSRK